MALLVTAALPSALLAPAPALQNGTATQLWVNGSVPGERASWPFGPEQHTFPHGFKDDEQITDVDSPTITPMLAQHNPTGQAVVVAPGGGYHFLAWNKEGTDIARWLNAVNVSAFVLKYRVPARPWLAFGEAPLMDAQRAMGLVRANADWLGLNASRLGFIGFSAGGHLTAHLSTTSSADRPHAALRRNYRRVDAADDLSCRPDFSLLVYPWALVEDATRSELTLNVTSGHPPAFLTQVTLREASMTLSTCERSFHDPLHTPTRGLPSCPSDVVSCAADHTLRMEFHLFHDILFALAAYTRSPYTRLSHTLSFRRRTTR